MFIAGLAPKYIAFSMLYVFVYKSIYQSRKKLPTIFVQNNLVHTLVSKLYRQSQSKPCITDWIQQQRNHRTPFRFKLIWALLSTLLHVKNIKIQLNNMYLRLLQSYKTTNSDIFLEQNRLSQCLAILL